MIYRRIYSFKRVIVLLLMLSDDKIILVQTQTKYCDMFRGDLISYTFIVCALRTTMNMDFIRNSINYFRIDVMNVSICSRYC